MVRVMGILNVTPDSFFDGGAWGDPGAAIAHAEQMLSEGADVIDVGGESTRPGADPVDEAEELRRVIPVVTRLAERCIVSIDTRKARVAEEAIEEGARIVNDVSASLWPVAAKHGVGWVAMHMKASPETMQHDPHYDDVVAEVREYLLERLQVARDAGVGQVWMDPGIGFGKTVEHNLLLLRHLDALTGLPARIMVGMSRKSFIGALADATDPADRLPGSLAAAALAVAAGADTIRTHDVGATVQAVRIASAICGSDAGGER